MTAPWPSIPLADVLTERREVPPDGALAGGEIRIVAKVGFHDGKIQLRNDGQTKTGMILVRPGDLLVSGINAAKGSIAVYDEGNTDPAAATIHYCAYIPNKARVDVCYLWWLLRSPVFRDLLLEQVPGGIKTELRAKRLLPIPIPLPPLDEQRRIVARIEQLAAKIEEARDLRRQATEEAEALCRAIIFASSDGPPGLTHMTELVKLREPDVIVDRTQTYDFAGVYCFGRGVFRSQRRHAMDFAYSRLTCLRAGNFVYPKLMAWEGALGIVPPDCDGLVVSPEFPVFEVNETRVLPEVLDVYFRTPEIWPLLAEASTGTNVRRRRLHPPAFLGFEMPLPPMSIQIRLRAVKAKLEAAAPLQAETAAQLDALLPSILDRAFKGEL